MEGLNQLRKGVLHLPRFADCRSGEAVFEGFVLKKLIMQAKFFLLYKYRQRFLASYFELLFDMNNVKI